MRFIMKLLSLWLGTGLLRLVVGEVEYLYNAANYPDLPEYGPLVSDSVTGPSISWKLTLWP